MRGVRGGGTSQLAGTSSCPVQLNNKPVLLLQYNFNNAIAIRRLYLKANLVPVCDRKAYGAFAICT